jgi:hypothetical protein
MDTTFLNRKFEAAQEQVATVLRLLHECSGQSWVGYFERLESSLSARDGEAAVRARDAIPNTGMGGFGEFLEANPKIQPSHRELLELVGDIKLHLRYGAVRERNS